MIENGVAYMRSFSLDYLIVPFMFVANGLFTGAGHTKFTLINSVLSSLLLRIPASYIFGIALNLGLLGIGFGAPIASLGSVILIAWFYFTGKWKVNTVTGEKMD